MTKMRLDNLSIHDPGIQQEPPSEECGVFFDEDEDFAAFTIHLQEIDVRYRVFMNKILEGYGVTSIVFPSA